METDGESIIPGFLEELRRRRVFRVVAFYAVAGWIVIEVSSTVLPGLNLPDWAPTLVIALVTLGFPVAIIMAWAFDITPEGITKTGPSEAPPNPAPAPSPTPAVAEAKLEAEPAPEPAAHWLRASPPRAPTGGTACWAGRGAKDKRRVVCWRGGAEWRGRVTTR